MGYVELALQARRARLDLRRNTETFVTSLRQAGLMAWEWSVGGEQSQDERPPDWDHLVFAKPLGFEPSSIHPDDREALSEAMEKLEWSDVCQVEYRTEIAGDNWRWILTRGRVVERDENGRPTSIAGTHQDITSRKQAETFAATQKELSLALSATSDLNEAMETCILAAREISDLESVGIYLAEDDSSLRLIAQSGFSQEWLEEIGRHNSGSPLAALIADGVPLYCCGADDPQQEWLGCATSRQGIRFIGVIPVIHQGSLVAAFLVGSRRLESIPDETRRSLESMAAQIGSAIVRIRSERDFHESEERFKAAFNTSPDAIVITRLADGTCLDVNEAFVSVTGYSREEVLGTAIRYSSLWRNPAEREAFLERLNRDGYVENLEASFSIKNGEIRIGLVSSRKIILRDEICLLSAIRYIDDLKMASQALAESEERYRTLTDNSLTGIYIHQHGQFRFVNRRLGKIMGYPEEELVGRHFWSFVHPEDRERIKSRGLAIAEGAHAETYTQFRCLRKDGEPRWLEVLSAPIVYEGQKANIGNVADITERKQAEEALRESEQMFRLLSEQSLMAVAVLQDGVYKYANRAMAKLLEYDVEEIVAWGPEEFIARAHPDDRELVLSQARMKQEGHPDQKLSYSFRVITRSNNVKWVDIYSKTVQFKGRKANLLTMLDITDRKRAEVQLLQSQKMEAVGTLAGGIAHDVNNLLQVVLGNVDIMLLRGKFTGSELRALHAIRRAARNGGDLVRRILTFSRQAETEMKPLDLSHEVRIVEGLLQRIFPRMIEIEMELADDLRAINADSAQLEQVLINLAVNATDAMADGGRLTLRTENVALDQAYCSLIPELRPGPYVLLTVSDTGHGMPKHVLKKIFDPFYTTKDPGHGTGLGLAMVFGIVKSHGGHISCESEEGAGTTFRAYFPAMIERASRKALGDAEMLEYGTETILLVDDEDLVRDMAKDILEYAGYSVLTAKNGIEGLDVYRRFKGEISLVLLDLIMPGMGGRQCLEQLTKIDPKVKVVVASGYSENGQGVEAVEVGALGFLGKPYDVKELLRTIRCIIDRG